MPVKSCGLSGILTNLLMKLLLLTESHHLARSRALKDVTVVSGPNRR